jgi:Flp pilus assembly pilin Flp
MSLEMRRFALHLWHDETGQDLIEYALLVALVATGSAILMPMSVHNTIGHVFSRVTSCLGRFGNGGG